MNYKLKSFILFVIFFGLYTAKLINSPKGKDFLNIRKLNESRIIGSKPQQIYVNFFKEKEGLPNPLQIFGSEFIAPPTINIKDYNSSAEISFDKETNSVEVPSGKDDLLLLISWEGLLTTTKKMFYGVMENLYLFLPIDFDTSRVTDMSYMFASPNKPIMDCRVSVSSFNTKNVETFEGMFQKGEFQFIDLGPWQKNENNDANTADMFKETTYAFSFYLPETEWMDFIESRPTIKKDAKEGKYYYDYDSDKTEKDNDEEEHKRQAKNCKEYFPSSSHEFTGKCFMCSNDDLPEGSEEICSNCPANSDNSAFGECICQKRYNQLKNGKCQLYYNNTCSLIEDEESCNAITKTCRWRDYECIQIRKFIGFEDRCRKIEVPKSDSRPNNTCTLNSTKDWLNNSTNNFL